MATHTAEVQVLTAEVRVLMVGSRQVTMSVYRQLDEAADEHEIEAFGRVRDGKDKEVEHDLVNRPDQWHSEHVGNIRFSYCRERTDWLHVIGRRSDDGVLVRSSIRRIVHASKGDPWDDVVRWTEYVCDEEMWSEWEALPLIVLAGLR